MTRLSKDTREYILNQVLKDWKGHKRLKKADDAVVKAAENLRLEILGGKRHETKMLKVEAEIRKMLPGVDHLYFNRGSFHVGGHFVRSPYDKISRRLSRAERDSYQGPALAEYLGAVEALGVITEERKTFEGKVASTLASVTTINKLLKVWPEVKKYLPKDTAVVNLPACIDVPAINAELGADE